MNFEQSKENIQPLRGGRNVSQLDVALQAQTNQEYQRELQQQRQEFECLISEYTGDDPLENWYNYISWIEQSYPKHGHEGNLLPLLEQCLAKFEYDKRYMNDRRFCRLWIKYIDLQNNPIELYHMMHARGLGRGCADLYRAWAYYHEAAGDFQNANHIFECGKRELAQPYEELEIAHKILIMAAGQHMLYGADEQKLVEKRQALTSLHSYKHGKVGSIRQPSRINVENTNMSTIPTTSSSNVPINIYNDRDEILRGNEAPPISLLLAAKRQDVTKEDTLKPGPWTTVPAKKRPKPPTLGMPSFVVHEDVDNKMTFPPYTSEVYTDWIVSLTLPEPKDPKMIPMYPKNKVYSQTNTEYSIEEVRSLRYLKKFQPNYSLPHDITQQQQQQIDMDKDESPLKQQILNNNYENQSVMKQAVEQQDAGMKFNSFMNSKNSSLKAFDVWNSPSPETSIHPPPRNLTKFSIYEQTNLGGGTIQDIANIDTQKVSAMKTPFNDLNADEFVETGSRGGMDIAAAAPVDCAKRLPIFDDDTSSSSNRSFDDDFVGQQQEQQQNFADLSCNTQMFNFNLNKMHVSTPQNNKNNNNNDNRDSVGKNSCKQLFSEGTPIQEKALSTILEETKTYGQSSSSSSGTATKSFSSHTRQNNMATISEEHHSYLAQNLKANAELRSSLLGNLMDFDTPQHTLPLTKIQQQSSPQQQQQPVNDSNGTSPTKITPIDYIPSDPFKPALIKTLLRQVGFPGRHTRGYYHLNSIPRLQVRKETITIGPDKYVLEKELGKGTYGTVLRGIDLKNGQTVALKYQKLVNEWEFYICRELQTRLNDHYLRDRFMDVRTGYFSEQASLLVSQFMPCGSLLDVANTIKQKRGRGMKESLCIYFCIEMLRIVQAMHSVKIIHADIKPDNFLVQLFPDNKVGLQLIDFGCSIDMSLLPSDTSFTRRVTTENFVCCEMLDGLPWNYHTDLFCVAATTHVLLFEKYIQVQKRDGLWSINQHMPRYLRLDLWNTFFSTLLNQQRGPADSEQLQTILEDSLKQKNDDYQIEMRYLLNILKNR